MSENKKLDSKKFLNRLYTTIIPIMYYVVVEVSISSIVDESNTTDNSNVKILSINHCLIDAQQFINNMTHISIDKNNIALHKTVALPTDTDPDGYFLVKNNEIENRYDIYNKCVNLNKGYLYNTASITINKNLFFQIITFLNFKGDYNYQTYEIENLSDTFKKGASNDNNTDKNNKQEFLRELKMKIKEIQEKRKKD